MRSDTLGDRLQVEFYRDRRHARIKFDDEVLSGRLVDLPCIIESHKTLDKKTLYKTGDVSQMMVCSQETLDIPTENIEELPASKRKEYLRKLTWSHGITPPLKNVRKRRFRKMATKKFVDSPEVEKEVRRLIREDINAVNVSFKVLTDEDKPNEDTQSMASEGPSRSQTPRMALDEDSLISSPTSDSNDKSELLRMLEEASCSSSSSEEAGSEGEEEDEDVEVLSVPSNEILALRSSVQELETQIEEQRLKIQNTANPILRERFESFLKLELEKQRRLKLEELERLQT